MFSDTEVFLLHQTRQMRVQGEATAADLMAGISQASHAARHNAAAARRARATAADAKRELAMLTQAAEHLLDENEALSAELVALRVEHAMTLRLLRECLDDLAAHA